MTVEQKKLAEDNEKLIYHVFKDLGISDTDEYYGTAAIALCNAAVKYDNNKNGKFAPFACVCIKNELNHDFRRANQYKRKSNKEAIYMDDENSNSNGLTIRETIGSNCHNPEDEAISLVTYEHLRNLCTPSQKRYLDLTILGYTNKDISNIMGICRQYVSELKVIVNRKYKENCI